MSTSQKWYDNKALLAFLILFLYPIGFIVIWIRDSPTIKKIGYSIMGFFGWLVTIFFCLIFFAAVFLGNDYYQLGEDAFKDKDYVGAIDYYSQVSDSDSNYVAAQKKIVEIKKIQEQEKLAQKAYKEKAVREVRKNVDYLISGKSNYSVILYDINVAEKDSNILGHQYKIVLEESDFIPKDTLTQWFSVSDTTFDYYAEDVGMEILSMNNNEEITYSSPPGYNRYVGNTRYGEWKEDSNGDSFWEFYGKYAFLRTMFGYNYPVYNYGYYDYVDGYKGKSSYYGRYVSSTGRYSYGTTSANSIGQTRSAFTDRVKSRVSRSGTSGTSRFSSKSTYTARSSSRTSSYSTSSRSGSRYSSAGSRSSSSRGGK